METGDGMLRGVSYPNSHVGLQSPHSPFNSAASTISSGAISPYQVNYMAGKFGYYLKFLRLKVNLKHYIHFTN